MIEQGVGQVSRLSCHIYPCIEVEVGSELCRSWTIEHRLFCVVFFKNCVLLVLKMYREALDTVRFAVGFESEEGRTRLRST